MKVIPLTEEQSAEFKRLLAALGTASREQSDAWERAREAERNLANAVTKVAPNGRLSDDGKFIVAYGEFGA